jgi:hypothetical protein
MLAEMSEAENNELRTLIRDLAMRRESHDRRQLYWALIKAEVWTPVTLSSAEAHIQPSDLHPLDREALGGLASFSVFTHDAAASAWQTIEGTGVALRLERISFVDLLPIVLDAGAGSLYLNPGSKYSGELYRHELETCLDGARKLARRAVNTPIEDVVPERAEGEEEPSVWARVRGLFK